MDVVLDRVRRGQADLTGVDPRLAPLLTAALSPRSAGRPHAREVVGAVGRYAAGAPATVVVPASRPAAEPTAAVSPSRTRVMEPYDARPVAGPRGTPAGGPAILDPPR